MNYTTRFRLLYCGRSEDIKLIENEIEYNEIIDSYIETGKYIVEKTEKTKLKNKVKIQKSTNKYTPDSMAPGKHKDKTWLEVSEKDPNYIKWMISATKDKELKNMLEKLSFRVIYENDGGISELEDCISFEPQIGYIFIYNNNKYIVENIDEDIIICGKPNY